LRIALAPDQLRALAGAIERGAAIEVVARVIDADPAQDDGLAAGRRLLLEIEGDARLDGPAPSAAADDAATIERLTPRERDVLELIAEGVTNRAIAERLGNSEHTVKFHVASLLGKLSAATRAELVAIAVRRGLIML
jgi:DNA-binding NarL/FixJ family response regulator